jgi:hypothetical protein
VIPTQAEIATERRTLKMAHGNIGASDPKADDKFKEWPQVQAPATKRRLF